MWFNEFNVYSSVGTRLMIDELGGFLIKKCRNLSRAKCTTLVLTGKKIQKRYTMINMPRYWHIGNQRNSMRCPDGPRKTVHQIVVDVAK
ncbi:hypothetical protein ACJIZ3_021979 [Penstemon smallii]|uniref:Uncharacterized protein n=1 Tax=Penstemon smallii TaxID=265156 RepID=A0ABD3SMZ0_9LAMI